MSLRARITLACAAAVATVAVLLGAIGYFPTRAELIDQVKAELRQIASPYLQAHRGADGGPQGQRGQHDGDGGAAMCQASHDTAMNRSRLGGATGDVQSVCPDGTIVADRAGGSRLPVTARVRAIARRASGSDYFTATVDGVHVEILATGDKPDHKAIEVALPLTGVDSLLDKLLVIFLIVVGVGVLLAGLVGLGVARAAVAPIIAFSRRTERAAADLQRPQRLDESGAVELRRLATSFNRTLDALERSVESQRHLIADASHELRTPMAALRSNIQIFLESGALGPSEQQALQQSILDELDELTQLVADVLELARGTRPGDQLERIELDELVRDAVERARRRDPGLRFTVDLAPAMIENHPDRVTRAVRNVIDNARKWSPAGGTVEVSLSGGVLTVRDHGPGFDPADLPHVFDRFYRADSARRMPGSGLGLAIVKQAAEARGGSATAANAEGGGAVLRVSF